MKGDSLIYPQNQSEVHIQNNTLHFSDAGWKYPHPVTGSGTHLTLTVTVFLINGWQYAHIHAVSVHIAPAISQTFDNILKIYS